MWLTRFAIARPFLIGLLTIALLLMGCLGWARMPVDLNPQADLPVVIVSAVYPGAGPGAVESLVAEPFEDALRVVARAQNVFTISQEGFCYGYVDFEVGTDIDRALSDCREAIDGIRGELPTGLREPAFARLDINAQPVVFLGLVGDRPLEELRRLADDALKPRLESVDGVGGVEVLGGKQREIAVEVDRDKLVQAGLQMSDLVAPLQAASQNVPGGRLKLGDRELGVRLVGEATSLDDLRNIPIPPPLGGLPDLSSLSRFGPPPHQPRRALRLGDLAEIREAAVDPDVRFRLQQREAVGLIVTKRGDGNTVQVSRDARQAALTVPLPHDVQLVVAREMAATVREALADVNTSIFLGILLCAGTIYLFLRNLRGTLIVATAIPVCLIGTFAPMAFGGYTLNQMTLLGLALSVGILVDDSIVCLEAITRRLQRGEEASQAALNGRADIARADTSTTLIDLSVFVPIAVMSGVVGQFFRDFGFVVAVAAALSLLVAFSLVPMLASRWYRADEPQSAAESRRAQAYERLEERYCGVLRWALLHRARVLLIAWSALLLTGLLASRSLGVDFIPAADLSTVVINLELPAGSSAEAAERVVAEVEARAAQVPDVETMFTTLGRIEMGFGVVSRRGPSYAQVNLTLKDRRGMLDRLLLRGGKLRRRSDGAVAQELRRALGAVPGARVHVVPIRGWGGAGPPVDFSLYGHDVVLMAGVGDQLLKRLEALPGLINTDRSWRLGQPEVQVRIDRQRAREVNVYPGAVARELRACIEGEIGLNCRLGDDLVPVRLRLRDVDRRVAGDVKRIPVGRTATRVLTIADVAEVVEAQGPTRIDRRNGLRDLNYKAYLREGVTLGEVRRQIEAVMAELGVQREGASAVAHNRYPSLVWGWRGDTETLASSSRSMALTALVAAVLVYLVMAALFNSPIHPLTIMLSVPIAGVGAILLLILTGSSLSMVSGVGMILLISIVVRNAVLLVDSILQLRSQGIERDQAVEQSGARRLRPILMTTLTTILGMLPVALKIGKGAEIRAPMAIAVIGGLTLSTLLTLVIIPVTYAILDDWTSGRRGPPE